jgi:hypothetical protein
MTMMGSDNGHAQNKASASRRGQTWDVGSAATLHESPSHNLALCPGSAGLEPLRFFAQMQPWTSQPPAAQNFHRICKHSQACARGAASFTALGGLKATAARDAVSGNKPACVMQFINTTCFVLVFTCPRRAVNAQMLPQWRV